jgi:hypothetical protein
MPETTFKFELPSETLNDVNEPQEANAIRPTLTTLSGMVTLVSLLQFRNASSPMLVTGHPPRIVGIAISPAVVFGIAIDDECEPPPTEALPSLTVYVHVMPLTVSVSAKAQNTIAGNNIAIARFIYSSPAPTNNDCAVETWADFIRRHVPSPRQFSARHQA